MHTKSRTYYQEQFLSGTHLAKESAYSQNKQTLRYEGSSASRMGENQSTEPAERPVKDSERSRDHIRHALGETGFSRAKYENARNSLKELHGGR